MSKAKALIAALVAMVAIGGLPAGAQAADFTADSYPVEIYGEQPAGEPHVWSVGGGNIECEEATFSGVDTEPSETQTITPIYNNCPVFGISAQMTMNGCDYLFDAGTLTEDGTAHGSVDLVCPEGKEVTFDTAFNVCTVHIPPQNGLEAVSYTNDGNHILVELNLTMKATVTKNSFLCPVAGGGVTASYTGDLTLEGEGGASQIDVG